MSATEPFTIAAKSEPFMVSMLPAAGPLVVVLPRYNGEVGVNVFNATDRPLELVPPAGERFADGATRVSVESSASVRWSSEDAAWTVSGAVAALAPPPAVPSALAPPPAAPSALAPPPATPSAVPPAAPAVSPTVATGRGRPAPLC